MTEKEYRSAEGVNKSTLWNLRRSPAHYKYFLDHPQEDTAAFRKQIREILTGKSAGDGSAFDLTVNATDWEIKKLAEALADFSGKWFEQ